MEITPEMKAQLEEQKKQCIFCKLISGEMPAKKVFEDDITVAMLDIYPAKKGHVVFLTKEHYPIMPYIPGNEFKHFFGLIPQLSKAIKDGMVTAGINVFIASGGVAGQQAPHFLVHLFPRDKGDGFLNFMFKLNDNSLEEDKVKMLSHNFPIMMSNHFQRNPASWHQGSGEQPAFLKDIYENSTVLYEDEIALCILPNKAAAPGHMVVYSKEEEKEVTNLSIESSAHMFFAASLAATAVFEGLGAQGTNIILKSGTTEDNPEGKLCIHILPRSQGDGLESMLWKPSQPDYDLDQIVSKIKDKTWKVKYDEEGKKKESSVQKTPKKEVIKISSNKKSTDSKSKTTEEEIRNAIEEWSQ
jgi:histidine triad (HIT) family protein